MNALLLTTALSLSAVAAFYSIAGLMAIFAAAPVAVAIMAAVLEVSKLVVAQWMFYNWKTIPAAMKVYFSSALIVLMIITSIGIFGFLSKAHIEQNISTGDVTAQVELVEEKIKLQQSIILDSKTTIDQLNYQIEKYTDLGAVSKGVEVRKQQANERESLLNQIEIAQNKIQELNEQKLELTTSIREVEAEVGPLKYLAALIYGDNIGNDLLEKAVRWFIILLVVVFDPLAVTMLVASKNFQTTSSYNDDITPLIGLMQTNHIDTLRRMDKLEKHFNMTLSVSPTSDMSYNDAPSEISDKNDHATKKRRFPPG